MKKLVWVLLGLVFLSCDDGDRIVTNFNFDSNSALQWCQVQDNNVLYIVNTNPTEAIAFNFLDPDFEGAFPENDQSQTLQIPLNQTNKLVYRTFNDNLPNNGRNYFCSGIPASEPKPIKEYESIDGGYIELQTFLIEETVNEIENTVEREFETYATAHNITFKNKNKEEEIVEEILKLGFFSRTVTYDLDNGEIVSD